METVANSEGGARSGRPDPVESLNLAAYQEEGIKWHGDDERMTFEMAVTLVDERTRTPEVHQRAAGLDPCPALLLLTQTSPDRHPHPQDLEKLQAAYYVHFGHDPMCHWL